jgi:hypothetical protein
MGASDNPNKDQNQRQLQQLTRKLLTRRKIRMQVSLPKQDQNQKLPMVMILLKMDQKTRWVLKWYLQERGVQMMELILCKKVKIKRLIVLKNKRKVLSNITKILKGRLAKLMVQVAPNLYRKCISVGRRGTAILNVKMQTQECLVFLQETCSSP